MRVDDLTSDLRRKELYKLEQGLAEKLKSMLRSMPAAEIVSNIGGPTALNLIFLGYSTGIYRAADLRKAAKHAKELIPLHEMAEAYRRLVEYSEQKALSGTTGNNE